MTGFRDIKADILRQIASGELAPGGLLPTELALTEVYGCARATVARALGELSDEGVLERKRKAGTRVRTTPQRQARFDIPLVRLEVEELGHRYGYRLLSRETAAAPVWLRTRLDLEEAAVALRVRCLHLANDRPYQLEDRWINLAALPNAATIDLERISPNEWLVATMPFSEVEISLSAIEAGREESDLLACATGAALFVIERATWWEENGLTHVRLFHPPGHRMTTRY